MTVISVDKDLDTLTLTLVADFDAPVERVWELWADPRQLERWWGPPGCPATVHEHDLIPGGRVTYVMDLPDGQTSRGWWRVTSVDPPAALAFTDGFAGPDGEPIADMPTTSVEMRLSERDRHTRMELRSVFSSREHMEQVIGWGAIEVFEQSVGQMDAVLAG
jgi:uncharacterized protein YndB with AHSA1/START domain